MSEPAVVDVETGEVIALMDRATAVALTARIRVDAENLFELAAEAYQGRAYLALGYGSWDEYVSAEFGELRLRLPREERAEQVASLREQGLSLRAIASVTGISEGTVRNDLGAGAQNYAPEPVSVLGRDGKEYPRKPAETTDQQDGEPSPTTTERLWDAHVRRNAPGSGMAVHYSSAEDQWNTPPHIVRAALDVLERFDLDPCSGGLHIPADTHYTEADDGLAQQWEGRVWMNPPYGRGISDWTRKLHDHYHNREVTEAIALVPARVDTEWWHAIAEHHLWCAIRGRLTFGNATAGAPFPSAAVYLGGDSVRFIEVFSELGIVYGAA